MSYQVLSLKLRPQRFDGVVGQKHITRTLQNAIGLDRVAHGYLVQEGLEKQPLPAFLQKC